MLASTLNAHLTRAPSRSSVLPFQPHRGAALRRRQSTCRSQNNGTGPDATTSSTDQIPPGCSRYAVTLKKPLGIVLEQDTKTGSIVLVEIRPEGSAAQDPRIQVGDQLVACSGVIYTKELSYNDTPVKAGMQNVRMTVQGESLKSVSAAIGSHPGHIPVTLEFQKCVI